MREYRVLDRRNFTIKGLKVEAQVSQYRVEQRLNILSAVILRMRRI